MKRIILSRFAILATTLTHAQLPKAKARIDSLPEYYNQTFDYNGVAFVSLKGRQLLKKGYGYNDRYKNIRNKADNVFMTGYITRQFTAGLILMPAKENKLDLQDKLSKYYPDFPSGDKITIEHLLTHTAGLYNYTEDTLWKKHPTMSLSHEQMIDIFKNKPLELHHTSFGINKYSPTYATFRSNDKQRAEYISATIYELFFLEKACIIQEEA